MGASTLSKEKRQEDILDRLQSSTLPAVPTGEVASEYSVSTKIVREDLNYLATEHEEVKKHQTTAGNLYEWTGRRSLAGDLRHVLGERSRTSVPGKLAVIGLLGFVGSLFCLLIPASNLLNGNVDQATTQSLFLTRIATGAALTYVVAVVVKKQFGEIRVDELPFVD